MIKRESSRLVKILLIDTTARDQTKVAILDKKEVVTLERPNRAQELQVMLNELFEQTQTQPSELKAIAVLTGPGSFTGTRIGISTANTLGYLYKLPLLPLADTDFEHALLHLQKEPLPDTVQTIKPAS